MARPRSWTDEQLVEIVPDCLSKRQVLDQLNLRPTGGNYTQLQAHMDRLGIDTSHFTGQGHNVGENYQQPRRVPLSEIMVENSTYKNSSHLAKRLVEEKILEPVCVACGLKEWQGHPIPLELDHVDGDHFNNLLENLRFLCRNDHALTQTFKGKNLTKKSFRSEKEVKTGPKEEVRKRPVFKFPT